MKMEFTPPPSLSPVIPVGESMRFLNVPHAEILLREILVEDFYKIGWIHDGSVVFDVGGCYGEFGLICAAEKKCRVLMYEPIKSNWLVAGCNHRLNEHLFGPYDVEIYHAAIGGKHVLSRKVLYNPDHPAGSGFLTGTEPELVPVLRLSDQILTRGTGRGFGRRSVCVKFDCEGAEREIFDEDPDWMEMVDQVTMEWHNSDGRYYEKILNTRGFTTKMFREIGFLGMLFASKN